MTSSTPEGGAGRAVGGRPRRSGPLDEAGVTALARHLAAALTPPLCLFLDGDLGAGKTTFARALVQALGHPGRVKSPTYGLLEHYALPRHDVLHLDLYRIADPGELEFLGIDDLLGERTILLVEWADRGRGALPEPDLLIRLEPAPAPPRGERPPAGETRTVTFYPHSRSGNVLCEFIDSLL